MSIETGGNVNVNTFHQDKFNLSFSNIPTLIGVTATQMYDLFVRSITVPDYNLDLLTSYVQNEAFFNPISKKNENLSQISITFLASENLLNYFNIFHFMQSIRYGEVSSEILRKHTIKEIRINLLDNNKREIGHLSLLQAFPVSLSSLNLTMGDSSEVNFTINFSYQEIKIHIREIET